MNKTTFPHSPKRRVARGLTTVVGATTAALLAFGFAASPALADEADGTYVGNALNGPKVSTDQGKVTTSLFNLELNDGTVLQTYCIDFETSIKDKASYQEDTWSNYPGKGDFAEPAKVHWILQNSYPSVEAETLADEAGIDGLNDKEAMGGTQAAIWHFSNGVKLEGKNDPKVEQVYDYLTENAEELPQTEEPDQSLEITVEDHEGEAGSTVGKFTVETSADSVPLDLEAPEGVELVDLESGEPVDSAGDGDQFTVKVPEDSDSGKATVTGSVSTDVNAGLLYKGLDDEKATQTLITAESGEATVESGAWVSWERAGEPEPEPSDKPEPSEEPEPEPSEEPEPEPEPSDANEKPAAPEKDEDEGGLPVTGTALTGLIIAAVIALGTGAAAIFLSRKRRTATLEG
ncbi:TQXA domain-containing protein [Lipingzhangella halophila]|uniref:TQXA domain-containing protein n=1 Tax=Lipingzhangella halophila TaxID=1783352 RepID=A0A7W7RLE7_9ACTN|nr:thioester domain-containing protein [Lipingzhangella halophila]MBB4933641.1 TQXA domain-containing protein [Lipingzhangella halophila]